MPVRSCSVKLWRFCRKLGQSQIFWRVLSLLEDTESFPVYRRVSNGWWRAGRRIVGQQVFVGIWFWLVKSFIGVGKLHGLGIFPRFRNGFGGGVEDAELPVE